MGSNIMIYPGNRICQLRMWTTLQNVENREYIQTWHVFVAVFCCFVFVHCVHMDVNRKYFAEECVHSTYQTFDFGTIDRQSGRCIMMSDVCFPPQTVNCIDSVLDLTSEYVCMLIDPKANACLCSITHLKETSASLFTADAVSRQVDLMSLCK